MNVESIGRSVQVNFNIDPCTYSLTTEIEDYKLTTKIYCLPSTGEFNNISGCLVWSGSSK